MKVSQYAYIMEDNNELILYTSLGKAIYKVVDENKVDVMKRILKDPDNKEIVQDENYNLLKKYGIIVDENINERQMADLTYLRDVMNSWLNLTIMPTEECNFRCKYCYESFKHGKISEDGIKAFEKFIYYNIGMYTGISVSWFGGEPLEALDEMEALSKILITACRKRKILYSAGIVTNGYNLTPDVLDRLIDMRITQIQVTLDGLKKNHDKYKVDKNGNPTFDVVMKNLLYIRDKCKKQTLSITIRTNVSQELLFDLDSVIEMYYNLFGQDKRFDFFFRPVGDWGGETVKSVEDSVFKPSQYNIVYSKIAQNDLPLNYKMYYRELTQGIDICYAAKDKSYIVGSDLTIYKCSCKFEGKYNHIGHIGYEGELEVDDNISTQWLSIGLNPTTKCNHCVLYPVCHNASCIADAVEKNIYSSNCPHMKSNLDSYLRIVSRNQQYIKII